MEDRTVPSFWVPKGPAPIVNGQTGGSSDAVSGRIAAVAADPIDPNTIYVAAAGGGVWKTTDGGTNWTPLTDAQETLFMGAIAVAPSNPNIIYAGTGEADNSRDSYYGRGVLKSTDGGMLWRLLGNDHFNRKTISQIVVNPNDPNTVYVAVNGGGSNGMSGDTGIWKSTDGGATWLNTTTGISSMDAYSDVQMDLLNPLTLYAAIGTRGGSAKNGVYKTTDGGSTWNIAGNVATGSGNGNTKIAIAPTNDSVVYVSIADPNTGGLAKMMKTVDGGGNWTALTSTPNYMGSQGWYDSTLAVDPLSADRVYAGGQHSFIRSLDGGATWSDISVGSDGHGPHVDHHGIDFDAAGRLIDGDDGGIWRLNNQEPVRWADLNGNLQITQFVGIALHPTNPNIAYGGSQDNGTEKFTGSSAWSLSIGGDGGFVRIDFNNPLTVYHTFFYSGRGFLQRSDNGGASWVGRTNGIDTTDPANFYPPYVMDPSNSARLLLGTNRVYETTDRAENWTPISTPNANGWIGNAAIDSLAIAPSDPNTIYASAGGNVFVTTNAGASWSQRNIAGNPHIADLVVDSTNSQIVYAVRDRFAVGHVFRTTDGGLTWSDITGNLPKLPVRTITLGSGTLYIGNDDGVYASTDLGASWTRLGDGLPHAQVHELVLNPALEILAAGTYGRGLWELSLATVATHFIVRPSADPVTAGSTFEITVAAVDDLSNPVPGYTGTVHFTSADGGATLPGDYTFTAADSGVHTFPLILIQAGNQTIMVTDPATAVSGSATLTVNPAAADHFSVTAPADSTAGTAFDITVTALDPFNNIDFNYQGTVHFTTTDQGTAVVLPPDTTFNATDAGVHTFSAAVVLVTAGSQTITVTDTVSGITGTATVATSAAAPDHILVTTPDTVFSGMAFDISLTVQDAFNNTVTTYAGTVQFTTTDNDPAVMLPPDYAFTASDAGVHIFSGGVTLITVGIQTITVNDPSAGISGQALVNVMAPGAPPGGGAYGRYGLLVHEVMPILSPLLDWPRSVDVLTATAYRTVVLVVPLSNLDPTSTATLFAWRRLAEWTIDLPSKGIWQPLCDPVSASDSPSREMLTIHWTTSK